MKPVFDLASTDVDGAITEAEHNVAGDTRAAFFRKAAIGGGTVLTSGAIMGMLPELASARPSRKQDLSILNFALTLEYLESAFYKQAVEKSGAYRPDVSNFAKLVSSHEATHVSALRRTIKSLGGKPINSPKFDFKGTTDEESRFLDTSFILENTGVHAYLGQAGRLKSKALLLVAASIVTVEARHSAGVATLIGDRPYSTSNKSITPSGAFDTGFSKRRILGAVKKTGFIKG